MTTADTVTLDATAAGGDERPRSDRGVLASLSLGMLLSSLGSNIANVGLPTLMKAFTAPFHEVQWVVLAYLLAVTTLIVSAGRLGDVIGRRRLLLMGTGLFTAASALCGIAPSLRLLIAARAVQGLGAAAMMAMTMAMVGRAIPQQKTGRAMGLLGTMSAVGTALGPSLGGVLIVAFDWRAIFLVCVPLGLVALLLSHRFLPADHPGTASAVTDFDHLGTLLLASTLTAYALAMTLHTAGFGLLNAGLLFAAAIGLGLFAFAESTVASPLIQPSVVRDPVLRAGFAMAALVTTVVMATLVVGPFFLAGALALDAARVGLVMSSGPVVAALTSAPSGRLVDRFGAKHATIIGLSAMLVGCVSMAAFAPTFGVSGYVSALALITAGYALFQTANNTTVMRRGLPGQVGLISGMLGLSRNLGLITGVAVMGALYAHAVGATDTMTATPAAIATGLRTTFGVGALLIGLALAIASVARSSPQDDPS